MRRALVVVVVCALMSPGIARAGLRLVGSSDDVTKFLEMLRTCTCKQLGLGSDGATVLLVAEPPIDECPGASQSLRTLVNGFLAGDQQLEITLGRNQPGVFLDAFGGDGRGEIDMADLEMVPDQPPPTSAGCSTRCQQLGHILGEYNRAATNGIPHVPGPGDPDFNDSHPVPEANTPGTGFGVENGVRGDLGQGATLVAGVWTPGGPPGTGTFTLRYSDGSAEVWDVVGNDIRSIRCP
jgi:hypothetical protein